MNFLKKELKRQFIYEIQYIVMIEEVLNFLLNKIGYSSGIQYV